MSRIDYPPGFSPEEIVQRANHNPKDILKIIDRYSDNFNYLNNILNERRTHLQELCDNWSSDNYSDYLETIRKICKTYREIADLSLNFEKYLRISS